jgi:hypothetical protein
VSAPEPGRPSLTDLDLARAAVDDALTGAGDLQVTAARLAGVAEAYVRRELAGPLASERVAARNAGRPAVAPRPDVWFPPPRYTRNGHRAPVDGRAPVGSRHRRPRWTALFEHINRLEARLMRGQPQHVRDGLEGRPAGGTTEVY